MRETRAWDLEKLNENKNTEEAERHRKGKYELREFIKAVLHRVSDQNCCFPLGRSTPNFARLRDKFLMNPRVLGTLDFLHHQQCFSTERKARVMRECLNLIGKRYLPKFQSLLSQRYFRRSLSDLFSSGFAPPPFFPCEKRESNTESLKQSEKRWVLHDN